MQDFASWLMNRKRKWRQQQGRSTPTSLPCKKRKKDPNAPKGASGSYIFYQNEMRSKVVQNPGASTKEVSGILSQRWTLLTDEEKQPYRDMSDEDKKRYEREMTAYNATPQHGMDGGMNEDSADRETKERRQCTKRRRFTIAQKLDILAELDGSHAKSIATLAAKHGIADTNSIHAWEDDKALFLQLVKEGKGHLKNITKK